jgi:hypothetical protein
MARPLQSALGLIFKAILGCMGAPVVAHRTKAIKALGAAIAVDPAYLSRSDIRASIHERISDSSPAVRDAAIDLVGKYIPDQPEVALQYYPSISSRIAVSYNITYLLRRKPSLTLSMLYLTRTLVQRSASESSSCSR